MTATIEIVRALRGHGYQFPASDRPSRLRQLAEALRRRAKWRLAAAVEAFAEAMMWGYACRADSRASEELPEALQQFDRAPGSSERRFAGRMAETCEREVLCVLRGGKL
jgi:hypothetical protein